MKSELIKSSIILSLLLGVEVFPSSSQAQDSSPQTEDFPASSTIYNESGAQDECPGVCTPHGGTWNGNWSSDSSNGKSVCGCTIPAPYSVDIPASLSQQNVQPECSKACEKSGGIWSGGWTDYSSTTGKDFTACGCL